MNERRGLVSFHREVSRCISALTTEGRFLFAESIHNIPPFSLSEIY